MTDEKYQLTLLELYREKYHTVHNSDLLMSILR